MQKGFTLVEIIIALAIVALFVTLPILAFSNNLKKDRDVKRKSDLHNLQLALQEYKQRKSVYPEEAGWDTALINEGYLKARPQDPKEGQPVANETGLTYTYVYQNTDGGAGYRLIARLEQDQKDANGQDSAAYYILSEKGSSLALVPYGSGLPVHTGLITNTPIPSISARPSLSPSSTKTPTPSRTPSPIPTGYAMVLANVGDSGHGGSLALAPDGNPMMAYISDGTLMFAKCNNLYCSNPGVTYSSLAGAVSGTPSLTTYTSIMSGSDGYPMIAYITQISGRNVSLYDCNNATCTSGVVRTIDAGSNSGYYPDIGLVSDGRPVITYWDSGNNDLAIFKCTQADCSTGGVKVFGGSANGNAFYPSIVIRNNGLPLVVYNSDTDQDIATVRCTAASCSQVSIDTPTFITSLDQALSHVSATLGSDGYPMISYYDETNKDLKYIRCANTDCSTASTAVTVDATGDVGPYNAITTGVDGFAVITYMVVNSGSDSNPVDADLKVAKCTNAACTSSVKTVLDIGNLGMFTDVVVPSDGRPFITYYDQGNTQFKAYKCGSTSCP